MNTSILQVVLLVLRTVTGFELNSVHNTRNSPSKYKNQKFLEMKPTSIFLFKKIKALLLQPFSKT